MEVQFDKLTTWNCFGSYFICCQPTLQSPSLFKQFLSHTLPLLQKCMRFNPDATVWVAKQRILCTLNQSLKDVLNYGLFQPASDGRDGKFLDEERILREYPQPISKGVPSLEVNPSLVQLAAIDSYLWTFNMCKLNQEAVICQFPCKSMIMKHVLLSCKN